MKSIIFMSVTTLGLLTSVVQSTWAQAAVAPDVCKAEYEQLKNTPHLKVKQREFKKLCTFQNAATSDEQFLLQKWGKEICSSLTNNEYQYELPCRYKNLIAQGRLSIAEALAIYGYSQSYYNYLTTENLSIKTGAANYEGYDVFNRVLFSAISKLNHYPEFQFNDVSYRGTSLHGRKYQVSAAVLTINRWNSSSCAKEVAFGPELIEKSEAEKAKIIAAEGEDAAGLEYMFMERDPKSVPQKMNPCEKIYFSENPEPPMTPDSNFGSGDLKIIFLPPANGVSKRVVLYPLSDRRSEAEVLVPPGTKFQIIKVVNPEDPSGDHINTIVTMQEVAP